MGKSKVFGTLISKTEGSVAVISAMGLVAFLGVVSLAIDMGHLYTVRNELQNVADASALAAANALIYDSGGVAVRDAVAAQQAAMTVAQKQSEASNQTAVDDAHRNDLTITIGKWNKYAGDPATAWTAVNDENSNGVQVTIRRGAGTVYGPVSNLFGGILGLNVSQVRATAIAFLDYSSKTESGSAASPQVPLALPSTGTNSPLASNGRSGWFARVFGPTEAVATTTKTLKFRDTGGVNVTATVPTDSVANLDSNQGYWYTGASSNSVPDTIKNTLKKIYTPTFTGTTSAPALLPDLTVGQQIYPRSEYCWGKAYIAPIFQEMQKAYYYKTTGSATTAPAAGTAWRTTMLVHGLKTTASLPRQGGFTPLARLLTFFSPTQAYACATITYPTIAVYGFVKVDITGVTYSTTSEDGVTIPGTTTTMTFPKTIAAPVPATGTTTYTSKKDFLERYPNSTWNLNTVTIKNITDATVSPPGSLPGGPSNQAINPGAPANTGMLNYSGATLVK
jgi:Flp pilus assembly protein TadG